MISILPPLANLPPLAKARPSRRRRALAAVLVFSGALLAAFGAEAHGATVHMTRDQLAPPELDIQVGETVDFHCHEFMPGGMVVRALDGSFTSPPLGRDQSWHHTFDKAGVYEFELVGFVMKGRIVVTAPGDAGASPGEGETAGDEKAE